MASVSNADENDHLTPYLRESAERVYMASANRVDIASIGEDGKICPPSLFLIACERYRKNCFIEAWVKAGQWFQEESHENAQRILLMNADDIKKKLAGIQV
jgi:hypothetical protein